MKKIAFIGTHGIGKTTIAHEVVANLKKQGYNADFLGEVVRMCPLPINESTTEKSQKWIMFSQCAKEFELEDKYDYLICDRSVLDSYVYYFNKFGRNFNLEPFVKEHLQSYFYFFKVPIIEGRLNIDGIRFVDLKFQKSIDSYIDEFLNEFEVPFINYKGVEQVLDLIKNGRRI